MASKPRHQMVAHTAKIQYFSKINPIVAKAGWLQSRGIKGEAVVIYRNPLITKDLESSGFPRG
jgi:hypothetical protein